MVDFSVIAAQNPWWIEKKAIVEDIHIQGYEEAKIKRRPEILGEFDLESDGVYVIRGPRQVGKTTLVKLLIKKLLKNLDSRRIFYFACDASGIEKGSDLAEALKLYISWARSVLPKERLYIFIDEATYLSNWSLGIKATFDLGLLKKTSLIATGSSAIDLKRGTERMPGRRGKKSGLDKTLIPMNFREFVNTLHPGVFKKFGSFPKWNQQTLFEAGESIALYGRQLEGLFERYLVTGGFPNPVSNEVSKGEIDLHIYEIYRDSTLGDLVKQRKQERFLRQLLLWVERMLTTPIDWNDATRETEIKHHETVRQYIEDLELSFIFNTIYRVKSIGKCLPSFRAGKKVYFNDPFILHTLRWWVYSFSNPWRAACEYVMNRENRGKLVETIVASHLKQHFNEIFHWKDTGEIDFIVCEEGDVKMMIEVKYRESVGPGDIRPLLSHGGGVVLTKKGLWFDRKRRTVFIPVYYFLAML